MRSAFIGLCLTATMMLPLGGSGAFAEDAPATPAPSQPVAPDNSILAFIAANPGCSELTDECVICAVVSGKPMCSTPGIACVREDVRCTSTTPATPKQ
jgi:hypothetical protein